MSASYSCVVMIVIGLIGGFFWGFWAGLTIRGFKEIFRIIKKNFVKNAKGVQNE